MLSSIILCVTVSFSRAYGELRQFLDIPSLPDVSRSNVNGRALISFYESNRRAQIHSLNPQFHPPYKAIIRHQPGFFRRRAGYHARYLGQLGIRINRNTRAYSIINSFSFFLKSLEFLLRIINRIRIIQGFYHSLINALVLYPLHRRSPDSNHLPSLLKRPVYALSLRSKALRLRRRLPAPPQCSPLSPIKLDHSSKNPAAESQRRRCTGYQTACKNSFFLLIFLPPVIYIYNRNEGLECRYPPFRSAECSMTFSRPHGGGVLSGTFSISCGNREVAVNPPTRRRGSFENLLNFLRKSRSSSKPAHTAAGLL